jgi:hypothetical protein
MRQLLPGALGILVGLSGCVQDDGGVFIESALAIDPTAKCVVNAKSGLALPAGLFDVSSPVRGYQAALKVRTNLPATFTNTDVTQSRTQQPNYPNYGAIDNNVIVFKSASVEFTTVTDAETAAALTATGKFTCDQSNTCVAKGSEALTSGSVFNVNTALSTESVVFMEAITAAEASLFAEALEDVLSTSQARQRIIAEIRVEGTTTGSGELRPVSSFPFPFAIDLCRGCLNPDNEFCAELPAPGGVEGESRPLNSAGCFVGQEFPTSACRCIQRSASGVETDLGPAVNDSCE